ncbi:EAL domain-containing protein [Mesorhizobium sp. NBSH29]|uniref:putative bifunctional diguanylate cyclase/phosphodiesterase n=1 Tax=Mesorhizobium sp. NBSH29 TaxID=2654249 RepID=UPI0018968F46|nr:bifunctional diguanylate cyclase/phosphodiesterase [Mesorhizobium sp. NBSH29]QPC87583.1 EAL domain-containing protein [Mesorhizobium sp. NBSH29]
MGVISCIVTEHNLWLVILAAITCVSGCWVALGLLKRANDRTGLQQSGWLFLSSVAAGSCVWCTHFIAMLAYNPGAPITFDPVLTLLSLMIVIAGSAYSFTIALKRFRGAPEWGGVGLGLSILAMHYTGMFAYRIDGIVEWNFGYIAASAIISAAFGALTLGQAVRRPYEGSHYLALAFMVLGVVGLHFTGMTALSVTPLNTGAVPTDPNVLNAMAIAVAGVGLIIAATGVASYLIDGRSSYESFLRLQHLAHNDALTGLPNRVSFAEELDREIARAADGNAKVAVIGIDLDRFKVINDLRGHNAGDQALKTIALRLSKETRLGEMVARVGGDEFAAVKRFTDQNDLLDFVSRLEAALFQPIRIDDFETVTGASIGVAVYPQDGDSKERLVSNADLAMYRAKADVTRAVCFYESRMDEASRSRRALAQDLRSAIELDQLEPYYQVQTDVQTGDIRGFEVLLRWNHPQFGQVPPAEFIPIAEENGQILSIGEWVLRTACRHAAAWALPYKIAVNLSPVQFAHSDLAKLVHEILLETGLAPSRLELEITESTIIADKMRTLHILRQIKALGVTIALDDFGTGYSSLDTLRSFPFDKVKLDRSFMNEVERSPQAKAIVRAVLTLGRSLEIPVLAEGVETDDQLTILRDELCDEAQGFLLGRPKPLDQLFAPTVLKGASQTVPLFSGRMQPAPLKRRLAG